MAATLTVMANATISPALPRLQRLFQDEPNVAILTRLLVTAPSLSMALLVPFARLAVDSIGRRVILLSDSSFCDRREHRAASGKLWDSDGFSGDSRHRRLLRISASRCEPAECGKPSSLFALHADLFPGMMAAAHRREDLNAWPAGAAIKLMRPDESRPRAE
ncbi:hypothetical protein [Mesorhizobium sp. CN2-181]|uniref:hypothetical protein n=1 Tax=Mesorhizobium yinganensis TaxID=3157707 RepID=UPI0032B7B687